MLLLTACSHLSGASTNVDSVPADGASKYPEFRGLTLLELQKKEADFPLNPEIKFELARLQWCGHSQSLAAQNWIWLRQFQKGRSEAMEASQLLEFLSRKQHSEIAWRLNCPKPPL